MDFDLVLQLFHFSLIHNEICIGDTVFNLFDQADIKLITSCKGENCQKHSICAMGTP